MRSENLSDERTTRRNASAYAGHVALALANGETSYADCPACGRQSKFSVTLTADGNILWRCFRPTCPLHRGGVNACNGPRRVVQEPSGRKTHPFLGKLTELPTDVERMLVNKYWLEDDHLRLLRAKYAPEQRRVAFPIFSPVGRRRGLSLRSYTGAEPKSLTRMDLPEPHQSYYHAGQYVKGETAWIVEDIISAVRVARYAPAVALLGVSWDATEIAAEHPNAVLALDKDASAHAIRMAQDSKILFKRLRVQLLDRDIKDTSEKELQRILSL